MDSDVCCSRDRTQAVLTDPVNPATIQVKECSKRNRWHFCKRIGPVRNRVRALRSLKIKFLLHILFSTKRFVAKRTEPIHVSSTGTECRLKKGRTFRIHIFYCLSPPHHHHLYCFYCSIVFLRFRESLFALNHIDSLSIPKFNIQCIWKIVQIFMLH